MKGNSERGTGNCRTRISTSLIQKAKARSGSNAKRNNPGVDKQSNLDWRTILRNLSFRQHHVLKQGKATNYTQKLQITNYAHVVAAKKHLVTEQISQCL